MSCCAPQLLLLSVKRYIMLLHGLAVMARVDAQPNVAIHVWLSIIVSTCSCGDNTSLHSTAVAR